MPVSACIGTQCWFIRVTDSQLNVLMNACVCLVHGADLSEYTDSQLNVVINVYDCLKLLLGTYCLFIRVRHWFPAQYLIAYSLTFVLPSSVSKSPVKKYPGADTVREYDSLDRIGARALSNFHRLKFDKVYLKLHQETPDTSLPGLATPQKDFLFVSKIRSLLFFG